MGPFGNIPNIVAELTGDNIPKDFSEDQGYPDPPNPCPVGKTGNRHALGFSWLVDRVFGRKLKILTSATNILRNSISILMTPYVFASRL